MISAIPKGQEAAMVQDKVLERKVFQAGEIIFKEGDEGHRAYVVQAGGVEIFKVKDGKKVVLGVIGPGGIFGEMALIDDVPRMAYAAAVDVTTVILISRQMLDDKLSKADPFLRGLINVFASNLRSMAQRNIVDDRPPPGGPAEPAA
ncbi:MAG: cyclic nucleotide-binding domain-containing protein [Rhodospirillales bacterium]|nr:cyclic nucleotide-binding domain-containing protein [Rhodospirillales bacterium]